MKVSLPDMSGPPVAWDCAVLTLFALGVANAVRHAYHHRKPAH